MPTCKRHTRGVETEHLVLRSLLYTLIFPGVVDTVPRVRANQVGL